MFDKSYGFTTKLEALCDHYNLKVSMVKKSIIDKDKFRFVYNLNNWQRKRFSIDLSYILLLYGYKPLPGLTKNTKPTMFVRNLLRGTKIHEDELSVDNTNSFLNIEKLKNEKDKNILGISGEDVAEVAQVFEENITKMDEMLKNDKRKKRRAAEGVIVRRFKGLESNLKNLIKPEYLISKKEIDKKPFLKKVAQLDGNITKNKEESNINSDKLTYKDILLQKPIKITCNDSSKAKLYDSTDLIKRCQQVYFESASSKVHEERMLKLDLISLEARNTEAELKKINSVSHLKIKHDESLRIDRKISKEYFTERKRALKMLREDNMHVSKIQSKSKIEIDEQDSIEVLKSFAKVVKTVESQNKNQGSRYRVLFDLNTEDVDGVVNGKVFKQDLIKGEEIKTIEGKLSSTTLYKFKGSVNKISKAKKMKDPKNREKSPRFKKIEKERNKRKERRSKLLKEVVSDVSKIKKITEFMSKVSSVKRGDKHVENIRPIENYKVMSEIKMLKIFERYIPKELINFNQEDDKKYLSYNIYNTPKEWLDHNIQLKLNKFRGFKIID